VCNDVVSCYDLVFFNISCVSWTSSAGRGAIGVPADQVPAPGQRMSFCNFSINIGNMKHRGEHMVMLIY
jgi:hypothetical protein